METNSSLTGTQEHSLMPTFPLGTAAEKITQKAKSLPPWILAWMIAITLFLFVEAIYLVVKNREASQGIIVNPTPIIRAPFSDK